VSPGVEVEEFLANFATAEVLDKEKAWAFKSFELYRRVLILELSCHGVYLLFLHFVLSFVAIPILWVVGLLPKSAYDSQLRCPFGRR